MKHLLVSLTVALSSASLFATTPLLARDLKTMHLENNFPRPYQVSISGAQPDQVVLYCTDVSAGCKGMREHLRKTGISFLDKNPQTDPQAGTEFDALGGQGVPLVVFKQRLMHGYYPSSFDKLYAKFHAGAAVAPGKNTLPKPPIPQNVASSSTQVGPGQVSSGHVELVEASAIQAYVQTHPHVVVQFTSPDAGCGPCVKAYAGFDAASAAHDDKVKFARVQWSPWVRFPKEIETYKLLAVPARLAFINGKVVRKDFGVHSQSEISAWVNKQFTPAK